MSERVKSDEKPAFDITDRGFRVRAWYLEDVPESKGDALIWIEREGVLLREFEYPAYRIWNIAAHFCDIVDGENDNHDGGYRAADWDGITPTGEPQPIERAPSKDGGA